MSWLLLVVISAVSSSLTRILQKVLLKDKDSDPFAFGFVFQLMVAVLFVIYTVTTNTFIFPDLSGLLINISLMSLFYSLGNLFTFKAFKLAEASEVVIIFTSSTLWSVVSAVVVLGEELSIVKIVGVLLIILGIIAVNYMKSKWKISRGHVFAIIGALLFGIAFTNDAFIIKHFSSVASYMIIAFALPAFNILLLHPKSVRHITYFLKRKVLINLTICSFVYALAAVTIFEAYKQGGAASVISPISQTSIIFTVIISYIFLKERDRLINKIVGGALTFIGVLLLI